MKTATFFLVMLLALTGNFTINAQKVPIKWGKLLQEDLAMKTYAQDDQATAVVLCDYGTVSAGPRVVYTRHVRVKILKDAGIAAGTIEIPYRSYQNYERISGLKAQTFNVNDKGEVVKTKIKRSAITDVAVDIRHQKKVFTLPALKAGSIFEYEYTLSSLDLVRMNNWYFQNPYPTLWSEYRVYIPRRFNYLVTFQKGRALDEEEQRQIADRLQWLYDNSVNKAYADLYKNDYLLYESPKKTAKVYLARGQNLRFVMDNMPSVKSDGTDQVATDIMPRVKVHLYLAEGYYPFYFRRILLATHEEYDAWDNSEYYSMWYHPGFVIYWLPTWEQATDKWLNDEHLGKRLSKKIKTGGGDLKVSGDSLHSVENIFSYVRNHVVWNGTYSIYADNKLRTVLKKGSGTSGEINLLLIDLLQQAGFEVNPILIRTHELGRIENIYPEQNLFNHIIAQVIINGQVKYLDATGKGSTFDLPGNVDGTHGWVLRSSGYGWEAVSNHTSAKSESNETATSL